MDMYSGTIYPGNITVHLIYFKFTFIEFSEPEPGAAFYIGKDPVIRVISRVRV